jgi:hypothetical protein
VISCFRREVNKNCACLVYYSTSSGNCLPTFRDNLSLLSLKVSGQSVTPIFKSFGTTYRSHLQMDFPEASVRNCHYSLHNNPEERVSLLRLLRPVARSLQDNKTERNFVTKPDIPLADVEGLWPHIAISTRSRSREKHPLQRHVLHISVSVWPHVSAQIPVDGFR